MKIIDLYNKSREKMYQWEIDQEEEDEKKSEENIEKDDINE